MATTKTTDSDFSSDVLQADKPVLVDFWATWCAPCRMLAPTIEALAEEYDGKAKVVKVDTGVGQQVAQKYGVQALPTIMVFKGGEIVDRKVGALPKEQITQMLDPHLA